MRIPPFPFFYIIPEGILKSEIRKKLYSNFKDYSADSMHEWNQSFALSKEVEGIEKKIKKSADKITLKKELCGSLPIKKIDKKEIEPSGELFFVIPSS